MSEIFRLRKYFEYQWKAKTKYYIHSPFVYQFYLNVLEGEEEIPVKDKQEKLLYRLVKYFNVENILSLNGSLDDLQYLKAFGSSAKTVLLSDFAQVRDPSSFDLILCEGNFDMSVVHKFLNNLNEKSIFIMKNIYEREDQNKMWNEIKQHPKVTLTIDLFQFGICFFRKDKLAKENFVLRY